MRGHVCGLSCASVCGSDKMPHGMQGVHPSAVANMLEEPPPPGEVLHPDTLQPISASDSPLQQDGDLHEPPTLQLFTASGLGKAVFKALSNIEPLEQDSYLAKKTAVTFCEPPEALCCCVTA